jgi:hypothetical protein
MNLLVVHMTWLLTIDSIFNLASSLPTSLALEPPFHPHHSIDFALSSKTLRHLTMAKEAEDTLPQRNTALMLVNILNLAHAVMRWFGSDYSPFFDGWCVISSLLGVGYCCYKSITTPRTTTDNWERDDRKSKEGRTRTFNLFRVEMWRSGV